MKVLKFGGTSLADAARMRQVAEIILREDDCVVVCSAMAGVTNALTELTIAWKTNNRESAAANLDGLQDKFRLTTFSLLSDNDAAARMAVDVDAHFEEIQRYIKGPYQAIGENWLLAQGEIITSKLFVAYLQSLGSNFSYLDAFTFMRIDADGEPVLAEIQAGISRELGSVPRGRYITQGFICLDHEGRPANLQRGGSDYTATLLGAALGATVIEIWTDIDGVRNNDPRYIDSTKPVRLMSFGEAAELAYFGAKILHPSCVWPARMYDIPILLKNTMEPNAPGTIIRKGADIQGIRAVAAKDGISMIRIRSGRMLNAYGFLRRVFEIFEIWKTPIDVITTSEVAVSVTIDKSAFLAPICAELEKLGDVEVESAQSIICVVGDVLAEDRGYAAQILESLKHLHVKMVSFGGSKNNLTVVVPESEKKEALQALHYGLFERQDDLLTPVNNPGFFAN